MMLTLLLELIYFVLVSSRPSEQERVRQWYERGNTWPPKWQEYSEKRKAAIAFREEELQLLPGARERWENYMQFTSSLMVPRFTEMGFEVRETPAEVQSKLKRELDKALANWDTIRNESIIDVLYTPIPSKFIDIPHVSRDVHWALKPHLEEWSGVQLAPTSIYGIRANRNGSSLIMHYDKIETHVISVIVHVDHEYYNDDQPWPIEIEDHDGNLHAVSLEPGQMLFYESAACLHGRRQILNGKYYASIFVHYQPVDRSIWQFSIEDVIANVPPHWNQGLVEDHGSRWAGQGLTIDSRVSDAAPPRIIDGEVIHDIRDFYSKLDL